MEGIKFLFEVLGLIALFGTLAFLFLKYGVTDDSVEDDQV